MKRTKLVIYFVFLLLFTLIITGIHISIVTVYGTDYNYIISIPSIYIFHFIISLILSFTVITVAKVDFDKVGFSFMALSVLKMLAAVLFLLPIIKSDEKELIPDVINFFVPYFIYLLLEIWIGLKFLSSHKKYIA